MVINSTSLGGEQSFILRLSGKDNNQSLYFSVYVIDIKSQIRISNIEQKTFDEVILGMGARVIEFDIP